jgi:hypothetical protein
VRLTAAASDAYAATQAVLSADATNEISDEAVQQLLTAGTKLFARKMEMEGRYFSPLASPDAVTATEGAILMTELMRAVDLNLFDLSMWAARPRDDEAEQADRR